MINFNYETEFTLDNEQAFADWLSAVIVSESKNEGEINYIFCSVAGTKFSKLNYLLILKSYNFINFLSIFQFKIELSHK